MLHLSPTPKGSGFRVQVQILAARLHTQIQPGPLPGAQHRDRRSVLQRTRSSDMIARNRELKNGGGKELQSTAFPTAFGRVVPFEILFCLGSDFVCFLVKPICELASHKWAVWQFEITKTRLVVVSKYVKILHNSINV